MNLSIKDLILKHKKSNWKANTFGERMADLVTSALGSWKFIILQSVFLVSWMVINICAWIFVWDPYPFILLNLVLSFQAAFSAPIIMMSQNRQSNIDRKNAENDYLVNVKAEMEINMLHKKIDDLKKKEIKKIMKAIEELKYDLRKDQK